MRAARRSGRAILRGPCASSRSGCSRDPSVYRLEPVAKIELAIGRRRTWYGQREPGRHAARPARASRCRRSEWPDGVAALAAWLRRLRVGARRRPRRPRGPSLVGPGSLDRHLPVDGRGARPGDRRRRARADRAQRLAGPAGAADRRAGAARWSAGARGSTRRARRRRRWIRDADRTIPIVSISGTNGKSTVTRLITTSCSWPASHVGTTTSDGVLVDERMVEPGDWTGPGGAQQILARIRHRRRGARDGPRRDRPARGGLRVERRQHPDERQRRTTSTCRASTRCPSWPRSSPRLPGSPSPTAGPS